MEHKALRTEMWRDRAEPSTTLEVWERYQWLLRGISAAGKAEEVFAKIGIVECMAFSSDGRILGVSTADGSLTMYDWQSGRALNMLRSAPARVLTPLVCSRGP